MTCINLLPWRVERRSRAKKKFVIFLSLVFISSVFIIYIINRCVNHQYQVQWHRNYHVEMKLKKLVSDLRAIKQLKALTGEWVRKIDMIRELQIERTMIIHLLNGIASSMPSGAYVHQLIRDKNKVILVGFSGSNSNILQLMQAIQNIHWVRVAHLESIKNMQNKTPINENEFKLSFILSPKTWLSAS